MVLGHSCLLVNTASSKTQSSTMARLLGLALVAGWVVPQGLYITLIDLISPEKSSHQYADRLLYTPNHLAVNGASHSNHIGFMLCITRLASPVVAQLSWHYLVIVIPLTTIVFISSVAEALKENQSKSDPSNCYCLRDFPVLLSLYFNLMWLIILRPLIILQTLVLAKEGNNFLPESPDYLDFGTHLVLIFSSLLVPFSSYGGFRSKINQSTCQIEIDHVDGISCDLDSIGSQCSSSICQ
uniref:Uncharacterized protein n=1 Tax=Tetranychus urticae TaxID=32264 RepID=T1KAY7_TETUR